MKEGILDDSWVGRRVILAPKSCGDWGGYGPVSDRAGKDVIISQGGKWRCGEEGMVDGFYVKGHVWVIRAKDILYEKKLLIIL